VIPDTASSATVKKLLTSTMPELPRGRLSRLLSTEEYDTWAVGKTAVVKFPKDPEHAAKLGVERALHPVLRDHLDDLVPPIVSTADRSDAFPFPFVAYGWVAGRQGQSIDGPMAKPRKWARDALAAAIAGALSALHAIPLKAAEAAGVGPSSRSLDAGVELGDEGAAWAGRIVGPSLDAFLVDPIPSSALTEGARVLCHGDLKGEHIFVSEDSRRLTAVIDWADVSIGDPAQDFAGLVIWLGPGFAREVLGAYTGPADGGTFDRAVFFARRDLLELVDRQLAGESAVPVPLIEAQLRAAFGP
jgi:aminoglycoside phosphotransferase (APT) family kinase protein